MLNLDYRLIYPLGSFILFLIYCAFFLLRKDLRKIMIITSVVTAVAGILFESFFFTDYWNPPAYFNFNILGLRVIPEDLLFGFSTPILSAFSYVVLFRKRLDKELKNVIRYLFRFLAFSSLFFFLFGFINVFFKINSIFAASIAAILLSAYFFLNRWDLIKEYIRVGIISTITTFIFYYLFQLFVGNSYLFSVWKLKDMGLGFTFLGIVMPLTEIQFAFFIPSFTITLVLYSSKQKVLS